jgi:SAM-dependent methyltransferase
MIGKQYEYAAMAKCEKELWWYKCLHDLTLKKINRIAGKNAIILDAGCGTGGMLAHLTKHGFMNTSGFDLSTDAIHYTVSKGTSNVQLLNILDCDSAYPFNSFDVIICNDILCLLNDGEDKVAFKKLVSLLKPGGSLIMNLPAGKFFEGTHDHAVGIKKRYSKKKIRQLAEDQLVKINEMYRWPFILSPLVFLLRLSQRGKLLFFREKEYKSDVRLPHPILNNLFYGLTSFENRVIGSKLWGSSILVTVMKL